MQEKRLEVFFDYACPYCLEAHERLAELLPAYPQVEVVWRPCESHPRPDRYGPHSDLCIQGMFFARDQKVDLWNYHERIYRAALRERVNVEEIDILAGCVEGLLDPDALCAALRDGRYGRELVEANRYAFQQSGVWVVPAYRMAGYGLDALEDIGVTKTQLRAFLEKC